jgi:hypothetical protein
MGNEINILLCSKQMGNEIKKIILNMIEDLNFVEKEEVLR